MSYFEWLKNVEHVSPGKLNKKWQEKTKLNLLKTVGVSIKEESPFFKDLGGPNEFDIVSSGLDDMITEAVQGSWRQAESSNVNLRDACYMIAIGEIHRNMRESGLSMS